MAAPVVVRVTARSVGIERIVVHLVVVDRLSARLHQLPAAHKVAEIVFFIVARRHRHADSDNQHNSQ